MSRPRWATLRRVCSPGQRGGVDARASLALTIVRRDRQRPLLPRAPRGCQSSGGKLGNESAKTWGSSEDLYIVYQVGYCSRPGRVSSHVARLGTWLPLVAHVLAQIDQHLVIADTGSQVRKTRPAIGTIPSRDRRPCRAGMAYLGRFQPSQSQMASPMTSSLSRPWSQGSSSVNIVTHCRCEHGMWVISVPQKQRCGPNASKICRR